MAFCLKRNFLPCMEGGSTKEILCLKQQPVALIFWEWCQSRANLHSLDCHPIMQQECALVMYVSRTEETLVGGTVWDSGGICNGFFQELVHNIGVRQEDECFLLLTFLISLSVFSEVVEYEIHWHTGDLKKADATGEVYLRIQGEKSDSGKRWLSSKNSLITFARGQVK